MKNTINQETCKKCKLCIEVCPCNILDLNENNEIYFIPERESICLECGQCMAVCITKSIQVNGYHYGQNIMDLPENKISYDLMLDFLANRRSVRNFKDKPVPKEVLQQIVDSISYTPYGSEHDKVHITVVDNRKTIEKALPLISKFLDDIVKWIENPFMRFMIKRKKGLETINTLQNHLYPIAKSGNYKLEYGDRITRDAPVIIIFHADKGAEEHTNNSLIYATYAMLTSHSLGLGASMIGLVPAGINKIKEVKDIFQIPPNHEAITSVIIGYPKIKYKHAVKREKTHINYISTR